MEFRLYAAVDLCDVPGVAKMKKNPAAVTLGRLGGLKGGKARARKLSAKRRKEIAVQAVRARWAKQRSLKETR